MDGLKRIEKSDRLSERSVMLKMERCAEFLARMIEKYGREVLEEIEYVWCRVFINVWVLNNRL